MFNGPPYFMGQFIIALLPLTEYLFFRAVFLRKKRRGFIPRTKKNPFAGSRRGSCEITLRGYLLTVYQVFPSSTRSVVLQPAPSMILPVVAFTGSTVVTPGL